MKRLAEWEKKLLPLSLLTTDEQARQIVTRNEGLLGALRKNTAYRGRVGCPHCTKSIKNDYLCHDCDWRFTVKKTSAINDMTCINFSFNGVTLCSVRKTVYRSGSSHEECIIYAAEFEKYSPFSNPKMRGRAFKFLKAHIKWGKRILDGTYREYAGRRCIW